MRRGAKFTAEQIIGKLREAEVELSRGKKIPEVCRKLGVTGRFKYQLGRKGVRNLSLALELDVVS